MWTEGGPFIPCAHRTGDARGKTEESADHGVKHRPAWGKPGGDVTGADAIDGAVDSSEQERPVVTNHGISPGWKDAGKVQQFVGDEGEEDGNERTGENRADASKHVAFRLRFAQGAPQERDSVLGLIDQTVVNGVKSELEAVGDAQLVEDVVQVVLDRLLADEKLLANFLVAEALGDELDNFLFAVAEKRFFAARARLGRLGERLHDFGGHAVVEPDFAGVNAMNAFYQQVCGGLLEDHAPRAKAHGANDVAIVLSGGEHDDACRKSVEVDFLEDGKAVFIGHAQIKEQNFWFEFGEELDALGAILRFTDNSNVFVGIEKFAETVAKDRVVVREKDANLLFSFGHVNRAGLRWSVALHGQGWTRRSTRPPQYAYAP